MTFIIMDSSVIHKTSERFRLNLDWEKATETEWAYCGAAGEVKWDVVSEEIGNFFKCTEFHIAVTRATSFSTDQQSLMSAIEPLVGVEDIIIWSEDYKEAIEFNKIGVYRKGSLVSSVRRP